MEALDLNGIEVLDPVEILDPETGSEDPPPDNGGDNNDKIDHGETFNEQVARQMSSIQKAVLSLLLGEKPVDMYDFAYAAMENKAFSDDDLRKMVSSGLLSSDDYEKIKASFNTSEG